MCSDTLTGKNFRKIYVTFQWLRPFLYGNRLFQSYSHVDSGLFQSYSRSDSGLFQSYSRSDSGLFQSYSHSDSGLLQSYSLSVRLFRPDSGVGQFQPNFGGSFQPTLCFTVLVGNNQKRCRTCPPLHSHPHKKVMIISGRRNKSKK